MVQTAVYAGAQLSLGGLLWAEKRWCEVPRAGHTVIVRPPAGTAGG